MKSYIPEYYFRNDREFNIYFIIINKNVLNTSSNFEYLSIG